MSTLEEQIEARKKEAGEKRIAHKAEAIAQFLGEDKKPRAGKWYAYADERLAITYTEACETSSEGYPQTGTSVCYDGKVVYAFDGDRKCSPRGEWYDPGVTGFVPGDWEQAFEALYQQAAFKASEAERAEKAERERTKADGEKIKRDTWGL